MTVRVQAYGYLSYFIHCPAILFHLSPSHGIFSSSPTACHRISIFSFILSLIDFILLLKQLSWVLEGDEDKEVKIKQRIKKEFPEIREEVVWARAQSSQISPVLG